jgi:hypothetical protein
MKCPEKVMKKKTDLPKEVWKNISQKKYNLKDS